MDKNNKQQLALETKRKHNLQRIKQGAISAIKSRSKQIVLLVYITAVAMLWLLRDSLFLANSSPAIAVLYSLILPVLFVFFGTIGLLGLLFLFGTPWGSGEINGGLQRIGLVNHAGESPLLIAKRNDKANPHIVQLEFAVNGIPKSVWEDKKAHIESALDMNIVKITEGVNKKRIVLHVVPAITSLPKVVQWKAEYLRPESFYLSIGICLLGPVTINLANIPHILLGGSTGSGKSILLKLLLMQCVKKGAVVYLADFKGGVDFRPVWHKKCTMIFEEEKLITVLTSIIEILEQRKRKFRAAGCANIDEYNRKAPLKIPRIIFACDEVAELLDKTGLSKESKEQIAKIESKLAVIARQGRAFGIHLILATQRPDANILAGQIRNNLDCRICGRADTILSQIILDNTDAADQIPKDAQGRFLLHDGTLIQGYLFNEEEWL